MGEIDLLTVIFAAAAFFVLGAIWYGVLFSKAWQRAAGVSDAAAKGGNLPLMFGLTFLFELLISVMLAHLYARSDPSNRAMMMMAVGIGATFMVPAIGIHYLYLRKKALHFLIDAGHVIVGMAAMGAVYVFMR